MKWMPRIAAFVMVLLGVLVAALVVWWQRVLPVAEGQLAVSWTGVRVTT